MDKKILNISASEKKRIFERDAYRCNICGRGIETGVQLDLDFIIPLNKGGKNSVDNLQTVCNQHNREKRPAFLNLNDVSQYTGVPKITILKWSSRGIISSPIREFFGATGCEGKWPLEVVREIKAIRNIQKEKRRPLEEAAMIAYTQLGYDPRKKTTEEKPNKFEMEIQISGLTDIVKAIKEKVFQRYGVKESKIKDENLSKKIEEALKKELVFTFRNMVKLTANLQDKSKK